MPSHRKQVYLTGTVCVKRLEKTLQINKMAVFVRSVFTKHIWESCVRLLCRMKRDHSLIVEFHATAMVDGRQPDRHGMNNEVIMTRAEKLEKIRLLVDGWLNQPDPEAGQGDSPEAADVLCDVRKVLDSADPPPPSPIDRLVEVARRQGLGRPAKIGKHVGGEDVARWYVDNDDERYVEVVGSVRSGNLWMCAVDHQVSRIHVVDDVDLAVVWVTRSLEDIQKEHEHG